MSSKEETHKTDKAGSKPLAAQPTTGNLSILAPQPGDPAAIAQQARLDPRSLTPANLLQLQRTLGNQAVDKLLSRIRPRPVIQTKLAVGAADDAYEQED